MNIQNTSRKKIPLNRKIILKKIHSLIDSLLIKHSYKSPNKWLKESLIVEILLFILLLISLCE